ncbi:S9 family peptidase [Stenotrophomonas maltophilia]|uniref:S9 family peptidase n=1 Tax=Stenotrophomonas maltophilia TaxID=40324 RepID=UPI00021E0D00|nr:prolyl oligopeptidase family serine peptidase [Stenotrophomonas maltophilia]AEM49633.1 peptidase S9B dipeptidylpeptidase IV domain protein [Stenotrophomonas maltophilia JV3]
MHVPAPLRFPFYAAILAFTGVISAASAQPLQPADYQRAERVHDSHLRGALRNASIVPNWLADGRFWYEREDAQGRRQAVLVDPAQTTRQTLFEPDALDTAVAPFGANGPRLRLASVQVMGDGLRLRFNGEMPIDCQWPRWHCVRSQGAMPPADALPSPAGDAWLQVRDHNLWLQSPGMAARALTTGGEPGHGYGVLPDFTLRGIPRRQGRMPARPFAVGWSPDGRYVAGIRYDERALQDYPYLESTPANSARPRVHTVKLGLLGDAQQVRDSLYVVDTRSGRQHDIALPEGWNTLSEAGILGWDGGRLYAVIAHFGAPRRLRLVEIEAGSGALRTVLEEASDTRLQLNVYSYNRPAVAILPGQDTAVWFSQRDGWGHLYRVRLSDGKVLRQLTRGRWVVRDLLGVDAAHGWAYFSAGGVEGGDPYVRGLYRVPLRGGAVQRLAADGSDHLADAGTGALFGGRAPQALSPHGGYLVDTVSSLVQPPRTVLRASDDGREVMVLEEADHHAVVAAGWRPPRRERVLAADGHTPIFATVYLPRDYRDDGSFPVIDAMYGGAFISNAPVTYAEAVSALNPVSRASLAELGFVVVSIDARGTGGRDKAFHDSSFLHAADVQLDDHVAALRQLGERYRGIDLQRVGIYGHSFGGYSAARALLRYPAFYKVGVASAGSHNFQGMYGGALHGMDRLFGGVLPATAMADGVPVPFAGLDNAALAGNLRGHLLLVYGELDENAPPALTLKLAAALNRAQRRYDLLYLARQDHELFRNDATYTHRMWDYFVRHLAGREPPETVLAPLPGGPG